jgi:hypothetical protein
MSGTLFGVFTADNGKSTTLTFAGPQKQTSPPVIDEQAGTVTIMTTYGGLYEKFSITGGPTLSLDAGIVTFVDVFEYTGDPNNPVGDFISGTRWATSRPPERRLRGPRAVPARPVEQR